jgi:hypothetical protein
MQQGRTGAPPVYVGGRSSMGVLLRLLAFWRGIRSPRARPSYNRLLVLPASSSRGHRGLFAPALPVASSPLLHCYCSTWAWSGCRVEWPVLSRPFAPHPLPLSRARARSDWFVLDSGVASRVLREPQDGVVASLTSGRSEGNAATLFAARSEPEGTGLRARAAGVGSVTCWRFRVTCVVGGCDVCCDESV